MTEPDYVLVGERAALGPLRTDLADTYRRWIHDLDVREGLVTVSIFALEAEERWVGETIEKSANPQPEVAAFTVYDTADGAPIGTATLFAIQWRLSRAMFGISLGARRGDGRGTEATRLVLDWAFHMLGLRNVMLEVLPHNGAAVRAYEKAGFRHLGTRRGAMLHRGEPCDVLLMDAVREDFESPVLARRAA
jgi:RimJ/RimL family protein N-acetyltransferase